jgi:hypothetical protein
MITETMEKATPINKLTALSHADRLDIPACSSGRAAMV